MRCVGGCSDGDKFDGEWRNDERHGKGAMVYCNGDSGVQEKYEGEWVEGRMHGRSVVRVPLLVLGSTSIISSIIGSRGITRPCITSCVI
jgi:hypothetical protein